MDRTEPATESKLERARELGDLPVSRWSLKAASCVAVGAAVVWAVPQLITHVSQLLRQSSMSSAYWSELGQLGALGVGLCLIVSVVTSLIGLLQTRFYINFDLLSPRLSRLWRWDSGTVAQSTEEQSGLGTHLAALLLAVIATGFLFRDILSLLNTNRLSLLADFKLVAGHMVLMIVCLAATIGLIGFFIERALYFRRQRMSRAELERDLRSQT